MTLKVDAAFRKSPLYAFRNPDMFPTSHKWVDWMFDLENMAPRQLGLELVQALDRRRILILLGAIPWGWVVYLRH